MSAPTSPVTRLPWRWANGRCERSVVSTKRSCPDTASSMCQRCWALACGKHLTTKGRPRCACGGAFGPIADPSLPRLGIVSIEDAPSSIAAIARAQDVMRENRDFYAEVGA